MNKRNENVPDSVASRREFLAQSTFGSLALTYMLGRERAWCADRGMASGQNPLVPKPPHLATKAKSVIYVFLQGGASQVDTFDPKPALNRFDGQLLPPSFRDQGLALQFIKVNEAKLMGSRLGFRKYGQCGLEMSTLFPNLGRLADDLALIRSCYHDQFVHGTALNMLYTGSFLSGYPSLGAWVLYGLGSESENLPAFMVMSETGLSGRNRNSFGSGFLPAVYQGTVVRTEGSPITNLARPAHVDASVQRTLLDQINQWNERYRESRVDDTRLAARIANYELAFRMQAAAPELIDVSKEPEHIKQMYGLEEEATAKFGRICLLGRRMVERGVRFVQLINADWDGHEECEKNVQNNAHKFDKPIAALLADLKQRGLLESTLVVCTSEFGRTPLMQGKDGRDHHPYGFSSWMAGGGVSGGQAIGATDEFGFRAAADKVHVHDFHAAVLALMGLDHLKLTFPFAGLDRRLTGVGREGVSDLPKRLIRG